MRRSAPKTPDHAEESLRSRQTPIYEVVDNCGGGTLTVTVKAPEAPR